MDMQQMENIHPPRKPYATVQPAKVGAEPRSCKPPSGRLPDVQDAGKLSNPVATDLHIETQADKNSHNTLIAKATLICPKNSKSHFWSEV